LKGANFFNLLLLYRKNILGAYKMSDYFDNYFKVIDEKSRAIDYKELVSASELADKANKDGGKIIIVGNGGSAAIASHVTIDFTKAAGMRAICFNESSLLTCFANDYGYENWVAKALEFYADKNDMVFLISSSGTSKNITNGARQAKEMGLSTVTLSGLSSENELRTLGDVNLWIDSTQYNVVEIVHQTWILSIIDYLINNKEIDC
jgi:D-sedoheptulose 7-phosphate isomerase